MKLGIMIDRLNIGGVEKIAIQEVIALREIGVDAYLIILSRSAVVPNAFPDLLQGVPIDFLDDRLPGLLKFSFKIPFFSFFSLFHLTYPVFIPFVMRKTEYDFIISHNSYTAFTALSLSKFSSIPYAIYIWDPICYIIKKAYQTGPISKLNFILHRVAIFIDKALVVNARVVYVAGVIHFQYISEIINKREKIHMLPPGYNTAKVLHLKRENYILAVTAWKKGKDLDKLIRLVASLDKIKLKIAGKWIQLDYLEEMQNYITELGLNNQIEILGELTEADLSKLYSKAFFTVIINNERGFGMAALEAAAHGCTFIIPDECGACNYFEDKVDGLYFKYDDVAELGRLISILLKDEDLALKMGHHAWITTQKSLTWRHHAERLLNAAKLGISL